MPARSATLSIPEEIRDPLDAACFVFPEDAEEVCIDMSRVKWIAPIGVVGLLAQCLRGRERGGGVIMQVLLPESREVRSYLAAIGFDQALRAQGVPVDEGGHVLRYGTLPYLPITNVRDEREMEEAANSLQEALQAGRAPRHLVDRAYDALSELTNNAREHGSPCFVIAQTHSGERSGTPGVHIAVADFGPGFRSTLAAYEPPSETAAIEMAFTEGVSGTGDRVRGLGLSAVRKSLESVDGARLEIFSRNGLVVYYNNGSLCSSEEPDCGGVLVSVHFPYKI